MRFLFLIFLSTLFFNLNTNCLAQWINDGFINTAICIADGDQKNPQIISIGDKGYILIWEDYRNGNEDIYAQRVTKGGYLSWDSEGIPITTAPGDQKNFNVINDRNYGAIVVWEDYRNNYPDIYAQRIDSNGTTLWGDNGIPVCSAPSFQYLPQLVGSEIGGAIFTWFDYRTGFFDIYAQRIDSSGNIKWQMDGIPICTAQGLQSHPRLISDDSSGAIICWQDHRNNNFDIYAQRVNSNGDFLWDSGGIPVCDYLGNQNYPQIIKSGNGAIIIWRDARSVTYDIYGQRIDFNGLKQWQPIGNWLEVTNNLYEDEIKAVEDGSDGVIIYFKTAMDYPDLHWLKCKRIGVNGEPLWNVPTSLAYMGSSLIGINNQNVGAWFAYVLDQKIKSQRVSLSGALSWPDGKIVGGNISEKYSPNLVSNGMQGAIICWYEKRGDDFDIYAQLIDRYGYLPVELISFNCNQIDDDVQLMWVTATELNNLGFEVQRKMESNEFITIGFVKGSGTTSELHHYSYIDRDLAPGKYFYRLKQIDHNGQYEFSQVVDIEIISNYALEQNYPNPFNPVTKIRYTIAASSLNPFSKGEGTLTILKVFDILGNEVATLVNENLQPGVYEYEFDASSLTSGVYFYKLISGNFTEVKKMILMR
ncbi:T9SS type A sorting domain-containing protein [Ignavibacterium sp.]|uniref:T9SS type A sorting domain-containing protein n=1 Tax=Ignavibacterium sp. TaxID=2651167 RepID=UPI0021FB99A5|nr:T9SS type A sorting domain-containing protein [Ignavibacterium sp.]BDQ02641.1 MAG: hypothetical protein KatS3mg037_1216 [Ignavibacterium sp.]